MDRDTSIPEDYSSLLRLYKKLEADFEESKQNSHDLARQLRVKDALIHDYQGEIEALQNAESSEHVKYTAKICSLEETVANLRMKHSENVAYLEAELLKKDKEVEELTQEIETLKRQKSVEEKSNVSIKFNEGIENENELLKEQCNELQEAFEHLQKRYVVMEENLQDYKEQVSELKASLEAKREELSEKSVLIDKLNDDLFTANRELEIYKNKPLQADSKGNSLFAEVDDRRVHLQKTLNDMKSSYLHLKQDHSKHEKIISHLRKENADLRALWKKDLEEMQQDYVEVIDSMNNRLKGLEETNSRLQQSLDEKPKPSSDDLCAEYEFYQDIIESKSSEIKNLEKKLSDRSVTMHMLSVSLAQAHKELRLLRLNEMDLQQQIEEVKDKEFIRSETETYNRLTIHGDELVLKSREDDENLETQQTDARSNLRSCLKPIENINSELVSPDDTHKEQYLNYQRNDENEHDNTSKCFEHENDASYTKYTKDDLPKQQTVPIENQENQNVDCDTSVAVKKRGVQFTEETLSPPSNPVRRRGTKMYIMKKKNHLVDSDVNN